MSVRVTDGGVRRMVGATERTERASYNAAPPRLQRPVGAGSFSRRIRAPSGIPAASSTTTPNSALVWLQYWDGSAWHDDLQVTCFNEWMAAMPVGWGRAVFDNDWFVIGWGC